MSEVSNSNKVTTHRNYFISVDRGDNPKLIACSPPLGYPTVAAAKEAKIKEIQDELRFYWEEINGLMDCIEEAEKTKEKIKG
jgi:hypothetical protein